MVAEDIRDTNSEASVVASLVHHPEFSFYSEHLLPNHFTDRENGMLYAAICKIARQEIKTIDTFNIVTAIGELESKWKQPDGTTIEKVQEFLDVSGSIARNTIEEYKICVDKVMNMAFRRDLFQNLKHCEAMCLNRDVEELEQTIYEAIDDVMLDYASTNEIPQYKDVIDDCWEEIKSRMGDGYAGTPFKFKTLNEFATIEAGELFIFAAEAKQGKSMMLLNCAIDLLRQDLSVLYIDSELNTRLFTARVLAHLTGIEYKRLTTGNYTPEEGARIDAAREWMKTRKFTHIYIPMFDQQSIYAACKKIKHTQGIDVLIVDYFKGSGDGDAFDSYQELGRFVDMVKNKICGDMNIAGIGAAQATVNGKVADSAKIGRNASTIALITDKTPEEIEADGPECGNKKLRVVLNRNGMQHAPGEYIDLHFDGNHILYEEAKQHIPQEPF